MAITSRRPVINAGIDEKINYRIDFASIFVWQNPSECRKMLLARMDITKRKSLTIMALSYIFYILCRPGDFHV